MSSRTERVAVVVVLAALALLGCSRSEDLGEASDAAARVQRVDGQHVSRVTLTRLAQTTLGIRTVPVSNAGLPGARTTYQVIPYSAVLYDAHGRTWTFIRTGPRSYQRARVTLDHVAGDLAYLREPLPPTTSVVTVGTAELLGAEEGVGGE